MKTVVVEKPVRDVDGLMSAIRAADPELGLVSVGTDPRRTYIYLDDTEMKDPSEHVHNWVDAPEFRVISSRPTGRDGVPEAYADGKEVHALTIQKVTPEGDILPGDEKILLSTPHTVPLSATKLRLEDGVVLASVGPISVPGEIVIEVRDTKGLIVAKRVTFRFIVPPKDEVPEEEGASENFADPAQVSLMGKLKRILRM